MPSQKDISSSNRWFSGAMLVSGRVGDSNQNLPECHKFASWEGRATPLKVYNFLHFTEFFKGDLIHDMGHHVINSSIPTVSKNEARGFISWRRRRRSWSFWRKHIGPSWDVNNIPSQKYNMVHLKMAPWSRRFLLENIIFSFHIELGKCIVSWKSKDASFQCPVSPEEIAVLAIKGWWWLIIP